MKIKQIRYTQLVSLLVVLVITSLPETLLAVPARQAIEILRQPDGTEISVIQFGDEWNNGLRTLSGHTLLRDEQSGFWMYAEQSVGGGLQKSPLAAGRDLPLGIPARLPLRSGQALSPPAAFNRSLPLQPAPNLGTQPSLIIFADFTPSVRVGSTATSLSGKFFGAANSVKHYYQTVSYGKFSLSPALETDVGLSGSVNDGIVSVTLNYAHPDPASSIDDRNLDITRDALVAANQFVDFSQFDSNSDGVISATELHVIIVVAGYERSFSTSPCGASVWGHRWGLFPPVVLDGKTVGETYSQFGEWHCANSDAPGHAATIGIMAHELGHDLGLPDLYDLDGSSAGIGTWSLMASGNWGQVSLPGDSPAHLDPWSKFFEGWINPTLVTGTLNDESISQSATQPDVYQLLPGTPLTGEYFLVENRQRTNYDAGLPSEGLLIWHIDAAKSANDNECYPGGPSCVSDHYLISLVQADNLYDLETGDNAGDAGDPWPGSSGKQTFDGTSSPNSNFYNGSATGVSASGITGPGSVVTATLSVLGNRPSVTVVATDNSATEAGATAGTFTVNLDRSIVSILTVSYSVGGTATPASDYLALSGSVVIPAGQTSAPISVTPVNDTTAGEPAETVIVRISANAAYTVGAQDNATVTIVDNDALPLPGTLQFSLGSYSVDEGGGTAAITVTRAGGSNGAVAVTFATSNGTAQAGSDYSTVNQTVSFGNGDTANKTVNIPIINDAAFEGNQTVNLALSNPTGGASLGTPSAALLTIVDNETAPVGTLQFSSASYSVNEAAGNAAIIVRRVGGSNGAVAVTFATSDETAQAGSDYTAVNQTVSFGNGDTANKTVNVPIINDADFEGNQTVNLALSNPTGGASLGTPNAALLTIVDNDPPPPPGTLQFSLGNYSVDEGSGTAAITVTRAGGSNGAVAVTFATSNGTAQSGSDYTAVNQTVNFGNGDTASKTVNVPIINDAVFEGNQTINLALGNPTGGASLGTPSAALLTIIDNETAPVGTLQFSSASYSVNEAAGNAAIIVRRVGGSNGAVAVTFATSDETAQAGSDYTAVNQTVSFGNGDTANKTINVAIINDAAFEGGQTVNLALSNPTGGASLGTPNAALLTIVDNDTPPGTLQFSLSTYSVNEAAGNAAITVRRVGGSNGAVAVTFATSDGTAQAGSDYTTVNQTVSFGSGDTANKTVNVPIINDADFEGNQTVNVALSNPTGGASLGTPNAALLTIIDNDPAPAGTLQLSLSSYEVNEAGDNAAITVTRVGGSNGAVAVTFVTSDGTAQAGSDYTAVNQTVSFGNGDTANKTVNVAIINDADFEGNQTVNVALSNPTGGASLGTPNAALLTIIDDDPAPLAILFVEPTGVCAGNLPCFTAITQALSTVVSKATLRVAQGTYPENVTVNSTGDFSLEGGWNAAFSNRATDPALTVVDGLGTGPVIALRAANGVAIVGTIDRFTIQNGSDQRGGGVLVHAFGGGMVDLTVSANVVKNNRSIDGGGGIGLYAEGASSTAKATMTNNVIHGNQTEGDGAGVYVFSDSASSSATVALTNNTISDNAANGDGGGLRTRATGGGAISVAVTNNIIWGNLALGGHDVAVRQESGGAGIVTAGFNDIGDIWSDADAPGTYTDLGNNIDANPKFLNLPAGDLSLGPTSPAVDQGTSNGAPDQDLQGNARPLGAEFDMGAHELISPLGGQLVIAPGVLPGSELGVAYIAALGLTGGQPPYHTISPAVLPCGLALSGDKITGIPCRIGKKPFTVQVTDQSGASLNKRYMLSTVKAVGIASAGLRRGRVGRKYVGALRASGGIKPFKWSLVSSGPLPTGLSFDPLTGKITGIPTAQENVGLTFRVRDSAGGEAERTLSLLIN